MEESRKLGIFQEVVLVFVFEAKNQDVLKYMFQWLAQLFDFDHQ